jgi:hypothetical protein
MCAYFHHSYMLGLHVLVHDVLFPSIPHVPLRFLTFRRIRHQDSKLALRRLARTHLYTASFPEGSAVEVPLFTRVPTTLKHSTCDIFACIGLGASSRCWVRIWPGVLMRGHAVVITVSCCRVYCACTGAPGELNGSRVLAALCLRPSDLSAMT